MELDFLRISEESEEGFNKIAEILFNRYAIQNEEAIYRLSEIEFYWTSPTHQDDSTYPRKYVNPSSGEWFFHYSGVDIALRNDEIDGYGGILIRGITDINTGESFKGPQVCMMKLFSGIKAFKDSFITKIIRYEFPKEKLRNTKRIGLGKNAEISGTEKLQYRFITLPIDY